MKAKADIPLYYWKAIEKCTIAGLKMLVRSQKGGCVVFKGKKIAKLGGLDTKPVTLTLVREILEEFRRKGWLEIYKISRHGIKYKLTCKSPLWYILRHYDVEYLVDIYEVYETHFNNGGEKNEMG